VASIALQNDYDNPAASDVLFASAGHLRVCRSSVTTLRHWFTGSTTNAMPEVFVDAYLCAPRRKLGTSDTITGDDGKEKQVDYPPLAFRYGFKAQETDSTDLLCRTPGVTPYMNEQFCSLFKILKKKRFTLSLQKPFKRLRIKKKWVDVNFREWYSDVNISQMPTNTLNWMFVVRGPLGRGSGDFTGPVAARVLYETLNVYKWIPLVQTGRPYSTVSAVADPDPTGQGLVVDSVLPIASVVNIS